jgi:hypothetical protein
MEVGKIKKQEEIGRHVQMLTREIRSTLDRHTILHTTLVELGRTLDLQDTGIWMPNVKNRTMELTHGVESHNLPAPYAVVSKDDETVQAVCFNSRAVLSSLERCFIAILKCAQSAFPCIVGTCLVDLNAFILFLLKCILSPRF